MRVLRYLLQAPLREMCPSFRLLPNSLGSPPISPVLGFSSVGSGVGGGVQSRLEPLFPSRQGNPAAQPTVPSGPPFTAPPGFHLTVQLPLFEPGSPGSGLKLGFRAVGTGAQQSWRFYLLPARERQPGTQPPSSPAPSSPRESLVSVP
uniref:Uncharacterized protein n=1 Tax=Pipistrellus kuhlii TaxID=59472 RepID=A0A7J8A802_PIPKU|nr:hypothetical protein mPipKuh1_008883 [Pipistrellus kuhlii]